MASTLMSRNTELLPQLSYRAQLCGEIYCSHNFETFSIICKSCSNEFDFSSTYLFIKHFKECIASVLPILSCSPESPVIAIKTEELEETKICSSSPLPIKELCQSNVELLSDKLPEEPSGILSKVANAIPRTQKLKVRILRASLNLPKMQVPDVNVEMVEDVSEKELLNMVSEEESNDEGYTDMVDLKERITDTIIDEYKKRPILWNEQLRSVASRSETSKNYEQIMDIVNSKYDLNYTLKQFRDKIYSIRSTYKKACKRFQETEGDREGLRSERLWYFDKMSFINGTLKDVKNDPADENYISQESNEDDEAVLDGEKLVPDSHDPTEVSFENDSYTDEDALTESENSKTPQKRKVRFSCEQLTAMVEFFKSSPNLWNPNHPSYNDQTQRKETYKTIIARLENDHKIQITPSQFCSRIHSMRSSYARHLGRQYSKEDLAIETRPWFYNLMSFLEPFTKNSLLVSSPEIKEDLKFLTENRSLMSDFIEQFKANKCLWDGMDKDRLSILANEKAIDKLFNMFSERNIDITKPQIRAAIGLLYSTVALAKKNKKQGGKSPTVWFYEHLEFLENAPRNHNKFCTHCSKRFRSIPEWEKHITKLGEYPYKCDICGKGFQIRNRFQAHYIKHQEPLKCKQCDYTSHDKANFMVHMRRHKDVRPFSCENCEKTFVTSSELKQHALVHSGQKPWVCDICGIAYTSSSHLSQHMKRHRDQRDHKCEICEKTFVSKQGLRNHIVLHSDVRQYVCKICGTGFKTLRNLRQHSSLHLAEKKYSCKICGKRFAQNAGMRSHLKTHYLFK